MTKVQKVPRTYNLREDLCDWLEAVAKWEGVSITDIVERELLKAKANYKAEPKMPPKELMQNQTETRQFKSQTDVTNELEKIGYRGARNSAALARVLCGKRNNYDAVFDYAVKNEWVADIMQYGKHIIDRKFMNLTGTVASTILHEAKEKNWSLDTICEFSHDIGKNPRPKTTNMCLIVSALKSAQENDKFQEQEIQANVLRDAFNVFVGKTELKGTYDISALPPKVEIMPNDKLKFD